MNVTCKYLAISSVILVAVAFSASAIARGGADLSDMDDNIRALMAKERARQLKPTDKDIDKHDKTGSTKSTRNGGGINKEGVKGGCDMSIGNDQKRPGQMNAKPQPIIITGPVIQTCK